MSDVDRRRRARRGLDARRRRLRVRVGTDSTALALGYGSLYNHSYRPNAETLETPDELVITALHRIEPGEEIFINYMGTAQDGVWFDLL